MSKTLEIKNLKKYYGTKNNITKAVNNLSLEIEEEAGSLEIQKNDSFKLYLND